jgi:polysaccharide biosynthesis transport protein
MPPGSNPDSSLQFITLRECWRILFKRRWIFISIFLSAVTAAAIYSFTATRIYRASAQVLIEKTSPAGISAIEMMFVDATGVEFFKTQQRILESRKIAREVNKRLNLAQYPEFNGKGSAGGPIPIQNVIGGLFNSSKNGPAAEKPDSSLDPADDSHLIAAFKARLKVDPVPNTRVLDVQFESADPHLAALVVNALVQAYMDWHLEIKISSQKNFSNFLDEQVKESRRKLEASEQALQQYREKYGVAAISPQLSGRMSEGAPDISRQKLAQVNAQLIEATKARIESETNYKNTVEIAGDPSRADSIPEVVASPVIIALKAQEVQLLRERAEKSEKFGPKHHIMVSLNQDIENLKKKKAEEIRNIVNAMKNRYEVTRKQEQSLQRALGTSQQEAISRDRISIQYQVLQQEVDTNRSLYDMLLKRMKEANVGEENRIVNIHEIDLAEVPKSPSKPRVVLNLAISVLAGLFLASGLVFFLEYVDDTVKTPEDLKKHLNLPYLGPVPIFSDQDEKTPYHELVLRNDPRSQASEAFRAIRTAILFSSPDHPPRSLLITSAGPQEGKTTIIGNMGAAMAQAGQKIMILDCDMRKPRVHKIFNAVNEKGLSNILVGEGDWGEFVQSTPVPNLEYIPSGPIPPNPSELLGSQRMRALLQDVSPAYDRVLIDCPPLAAVTDPVVLSRFVEGVVLVVKTGNTSRDLLATVVARLNDVQAQILGVILNEMKIGRTGDYNYYAYYGDDGQKKKKKRPLPREEKAATL